MKKVMSLALIMGKTVSQPEFKSGKYITSFLFKLKVNLAALSISRRICDQRSKLNEASELSGEKFIFLIFFYVI